MMIGPKVAAVAAMDQTRVVGFEGKLPWHVPEDMAHFKQLTSGHVVVMGRKTWDSLPAKFKPLPGRLNVVVSRKATELQLPDGVMRAGSPEQAIRVAQAADNTKTVWIIGGAELWTALLPYCHEVHLTSIPGSHRGDAWFPAFEDNYAHVSERKGDACSFHVYANRQPKVL